MKTIQEYFCAADKNELAKEYLKTYPIKLNEIKNKELTVEEIIFKAEKKILEYIERLQSLKIEKSEDGKKEFYLFIKFVVQNSKKTLIH